MISGVIECDDEKVTRLGMRTSDFEGQGQLKEPNHRLIFQGRTPLVRSPQNNYTQGVQSGTLLNQVFKETNLAGFSVK